jgi:hypothetical protein
MSDLPSADGPSLSPGTETTNTVNTAAVSESTSAATTSASVESKRVDTEDPPPKDKRRTAGELLLITVVWFFGIGFSVWLVFAWSGYSSKYSQTTESWKLNATKMIEITVVAEDRTNLACSSDVTIEGLHCGYRANQQPWGGEPATDSQVLQPFNTVANELFLGAGLWTSPKLPKQLPGTRFTVMCNYKVLGAAKSMSLRWAPKGSFDPLKSSVAVGSLTDCVIPE